MAEEICGVVPRDKLGKVKARLLLGKVFSNMQHPTQRVRTFGIALVNDFDQAGDILDCQKCFSRR